MYVVRRSTHNPLIAPILDHPWESQATFNPSPVRVGATTYVLYRAISSPDSLLVPGGMSTVGISTMQDGKHVQNRRQFIVPTEEWEKYGCEDPRVTKLEGKYYTFYTALSEYPFKASGIKVAVAVSKDLESIERKHLVTPFNAKAFALFPKRVNGKVTAILTAHTDEPPSKMALVQCDKIEDLWSEKFWHKWHQKIDSWTLDPRRKDTDHIESGAPPIETPAGWLVIYSHIQNYFGGGKRTFGIEAILLDKKDPRKIIGRTPGPMLVPEDIYERWGLVGDIVFPTGVLLQKNGRLDVYYGAADTVSARMSLNLSDLLAAMTRSNRKPLVARYPKNPIIVPNPEHAWESRATFNAGVVETGGMIRIMYRAMGEDNTSVLGYAETKDGFRLTKHLSEPAYVPRADFEMKRGSPTGNSGCEDPRLTQVGDTVHMTYTAYDGVNPTRVALSSIKVKDFEAHRFDKFSMPILISPPGVNDKNMCILPKKVNGNYVLYHRIGEQICADFLPDLKFEDSQINRCIEILGPRAGMWDSQKVGVTGAPIETPEGWLLIYHGVSRSTTYRFGAALLEKENATTVIARTIDPIFEPTEKYELEGQVPNVVFSCGVVKRKDTLFIYYGGGDSVVAVATVPVKKILDILLPKNLK